MVLNPAGVVPLLADIERSEPSFKTRQMILRAAPTLVVYQLIGCWLVGWTDAATAHAVTIALYAWVLPNAVRQGSLMLISGYTHYYEIPLRDSLF